jgi:UDP-3-O-[3-hydroxymyristoyl] N-acetylglucosamine deacetylase
MKQATIKKSAGLAGIGLHKGREAKVVFRPAAPDSGIIIINRGLKYRLDIRRVAGTNRGTVLKNGRSVLHTIEHMLSAVKAMGIHNIEIEIDGNEAPALDGSSAGFVAALNSAGIKKQASPAKQFIISEPVALSDNGRYMAVLPGRGFEVRYFSDFSKHGVAPEECGLKVTPAAYESEICRARTFGFKAEIDWLISAGLIKGASLENAVLIDGGRPVAGALRYRDELTRHKVLDIIGDFAFIEGDLNLTVIAYKTGHKQNIEMVRRLLKNN